jgi:hypothetical protein
MYDYGRYIPRFHEIDVKDFKEDGKFMTIPNISIQNI